MKKRTITIFLILILLLGTGLRIWQLGKVPLSPDWDEVALGYDAYSIMHTGRDEFGAFLPVVLRSFDDYKPALYAYLAIPTVAVLGLTVDAVRLPSVFMGVLGILLMYFLVKELLGPENSGDSENQRFRNADNLKKWRSEFSEYSEILALLAAFLMAISPWQIQFSRVAFETNTGLTFNLLVGLFLLKGLKKPWMLSLTALFAGLNFAVYQSERVFTPLLIIALIIIYRKAFFALSKKYIAAAILIGFIVSLPTVITIVGNPITLERANGTSIFSQKTPELTNNYIRFMVDKNDNDSIGSLFDNKRVIFAKEIISGYLVHFDPNWLFLESDNPRHHAPGMGNLYLIDLPFLLIGLYFFIFGKFDRKTKAFVFSWLLLAPVPSAVTFGVPHAVRTMNLLPMFLILIAIGYLEVYRLSRKYLVFSKYKVWVNGLYVLFIVLALFNFVYYLNEYFVEQNYFNAADWQYGYTQAIPYIEQIQGQYKQIVVSDQAPLDQSYMFFLFYMKYPPQQYQQFVAEGKNLTTDDHTFGKYDFRPFNWNTEKIKQNTLYVGSVSNFPNNIIAKQTIDYPDGSPAILIVDPKDNKK